MSRTTVNKAGTVLRSAGRAQKEKADVDRAEENLELLRHELEELQNTFKNDHDQGSEKFDIINEELQTVLMRPTKSNIDVQFMCFMWTPYWQLSGGGSNLA